MPNERKFTYDVFISYARADGEWAPKILLPRLEKAGLRCAIDIRDFAPGAPVVEEIRRCIEDSRKTLMVLTPTYLEREWTTFETRVVQTISPANRDRRLIPLLKKECKAPPEIESLTNVNFATPDDPEWPWAQLITALGGNIEYKTEKEPRRESWFLAHPYGMPPNFTGRDAEREMLSRWLNHEPEHRLLVLRALGGFGKSALSWRWLMRDVDPG
ncbi:MAG: toll/interleukin-1 receptor domain-containing protein, partial [Desulfobacterales bacterium]|nr:toll/interleukin-1 receptor domain-containing protein [Desulfobacterales bacterium]